MSGMPKIVVERLRGEPVERRKVEIVERKAI